MPAARVPDLVPVEEALAQLGVSRQTLYAYVSRGLIRAEPAPGDPRRSLYDKRDLDRLIERRRRGRARRDVAASAIDFGEPVLASAITRIGDDGLFYRERDAVTLAASATLEEVAEILWKGPRAVATPLAQTQRVATLGPRAGEADRSSPSRPTTTSTAPIECCLLAVATEAVGTPIWGRADDALLADAARLLRRVAEAVAGSAGPGPIHAVLARAWGLDAAGADLVRRALVLCADHELNPSTFAVRVVASTEASLAACVLAGLAALTGPRHGGATDRVRALMAEPGVSEDPHQAFAARLARGERLPGFGHRLYPGGDPRAADLLAALGPDGHWARLIAAGEELTGRRPNIDLALVALEHRLGLRPGTAIGLFATGRTAGWIAHALEQQKAGNLIRPRARYIGVGV
jgi:citrate synthase